MQHTLIIYKHISFLLILSFPKHKFFFLFFWYPFVHILVEIHSRPGTKILRRDWHPIFFIHQIHNSVSDYLSQCYFVNDNNSDNDSDNDNDSDLWQLLKFKLWHLWRWHDRQTVESLCKPLQCLFGIRVTFSWNSIDRAFICFPTKTCLSHTIGGKYCWCVKILIF